jgi:hypothetical protein
MSARDGSLQQLVSQHERPARAIAAYCFLTSARTVSFDFIANLLG